MQLGQDTQAVVLLTARFGAEDHKDARPLGPKEWGDFADWLRLRSSRPGELINGNSATILAEWSHPKVTSERLAKLLQRGNAMALALEKWDRAGIWILTRADEHYPSRLKKRLGKAAPPVLFGCGKPELLAGGGLAVVGSRNASEADLEFCRKVGATAATEGHSVVSGGARGVDETVMLAALEHEGTVIGVVADSLLRAITRPAYRRALRSGDLVLVSPYHPDARFQVGNAMGRNKYIYCLADAGVIVACEKERGGTFTGAKETLRHDWVPVWTRQTKNSADGVAALEKLGARRLPEARFKIAELLVQQSPSPDSQLAELETTHLESEEPAPYLAPESQAAMDPAEALFNAFLEQLRPMIQADPKKPDEIAAKLQLKPNQAKIWLQKAEEAGLVERCKTKPVRYQWAAQIQLSL